MSFLNSASLPSLAARGVQVPSYDRAALQTGVVHFGPGAFHRVHQACYLDSALASDSRWGICEVALHSAGVRDALAPQEWLYTIAVLDEQSSFRVIGAVMGALVAPESPQAVLDRLVAPDTRLITATITEKGYCLTKEGGLDAAHPDIAHDLQQPHAPKSFVGYLSRALQLRHERGLAAPNVVSCDNLADNGKRLRRAVLEFAQRVSPSILPWLENEVSFPSTMVDSITPATDDALRNRVAESLGVTDRWPVQREFFSQWVIEDAMRGPQPDWAAVGVTVTNDVAGYERAKLRLLNGAHSTLAYTGRLAGYDTVATAMTDPALSSFVRDLMRSEIAPSIKAPTGFSVATYIDTVLRRFRNPAIRHLLAQIAWDGSQKLPFRTIATMIDNLAAGRSIEKLAVPLAAWFHFVQRQIASGEKLVDPLAERLGNIAARCTGAASDDVGLFLALDTVFPAVLAHNATVRAALERAYARLGEVKGPKDLPAALTRA